MAVKQRRNVAVGQSEPFVSVLPLPIVTTRNPTANDFAEIGTIWVNRSTSAIFVLGSVVNNVATWTTTAGAAGTLNVTPGPFTVNATVNAPQQIFLRTNAGANETIDILSSQGTGAASVIMHSTVGGVTIDGGLATADAVNIVASNVAGGIDIDAGTAGVIVDTTGAISLDAAAASNFTTTGAGIDITLDATAGRVVIDGGEAAANAVTIDASDAAGGIDIDSGTNGITIDSTGLIAIDSSFANIPAISLTASNAAGTIDITAGATITLDTTGAAGEIQVVAGVNAAAGTAIVQNTWTGVVTLTGLTTASGATEDITITNAKVAATSGILVTAANLGANDAQMTVTRVTPALGSFVVRLTNNGAQALNGNVILSFIVLS